MFQVIVADVNPGVPGETSEMTGASVSVMSPAVVNCRYGEADGEVRVFPDASAEMT